MSISYIEGIPSQGGARYGISFIASFAIVFPVGAVFFIFLSLMLPSRTAYAANIYAQYADDAVYPGNQLPIDNAYMINVALVDYVQLELEIDNDSQLGTTYYCPIAPNTGVVFFMYRSDGSMAYYHCITSAEAAGKLGKKAVYTFAEHDKFATGDNMSMLVNGPATVFGAVKDGDFKFYLAMGDKDGIGSPAGINSIAQYSSDAYSPPDADGSLPPGMIPENGTADTNSITFAAIPSSFFATDTVAFEIEIEPFDIPFSGVPSAVSDDVPSGSLASTTIKWLQPGKYHWAARAIDKTAGFISPWVEFLTPGNVDLTVPVVSSREPIIIVPGIMGSRLDSPDGGEIWPDAHDMIYSGSDDFLDYLKLNPDGSVSPDRPVSTPDVIRNVTSSFLFFNFDSVIYGDLINKFTGEGYSEGKDLFVVPYDWRLGIESSTEALASVISEAVAVSPFGKINVIAHSMGGLLMKEYLAMNGSSAAAASSIDKLIFVGVPQLGAPLAYKLLNYGDDMGLSWLWMGLNQSEVKSLAENMPSVYELLPSRKSVDLSGGYVEDFRNGGDKVYGYDDSIVPNATLFSEADIFHRGIDDLDLSDMDVYNIVGCSRPTITGFYLYDNSEVELRRGVGDGTVPETSATETSGDLKNYFILDDGTHMNHMDLVRNSRPLGLIGDIIDSAVDSNSLASGISSDLSDCVAPSMVPGGANETTVEFSTHSPVALNVYDSEGRHVGFNASGTIETAIPGSEFDQVGNNDFVLLPSPKDGESYKVVADGLASGEMKMEVKEYSGDVAATATAVYSDIPISGTSTTAEIDYSGSIGTDNGLKLDGDGDGITDAVISPDDGIQTSTLSSSSSSSIIFADSDTYISSAEKNRNFGGSDSLRVGGSGGEAALVHFDLSTMDQIDSDNIVSAELILPQIADSGSSAQSSGNIEDMAMAVHSLNRGWTENGATRSFSGDDGSGNSCMAQPADWLFSSVDAGDMEAAGVYAPDLKEASFDVTDDIKNILDGINENFGWAIIDAKTVGGETADANEGEYVAGSRESPKGPRLVIQFK